MPLVAVALVRGWTGATLTLAMEFGVGALVLVVVDVIVLRSVNLSLERIAASVLNVDVQWAWLPVRISSEQCVPLSDREQLSAPDACARRVEAGLRRDGGSDGLAEDLDRELGADGRCSTGTHA